MGINCQMPIVMYYVIYAEQKQESIIIGARQGASVLIAESLLPLENKDVKNVYGKRKRGENKMEKDYKSAWNKLEEELEESLKYFKDGIMCSISESIIGERICKMMLDKMKELIDE